jgi:hypothetical protein
MPGVERTQSAGDKVRINEMNYAATGVGEEIAGKGRLTGAVRSGDDDASGTFGWGPTDNQGTAEHNLDLSRRRAANEVSMKLMRRSQPSHSLRSRCLLSITRSFGPTPAAG